MQKIALITGAGSGIGRAAAVALLCVALVAGLIAATDFAADRSSLQAAQHAAGNAVVQLGTESSVPD